MDATSSIVSVGCAASQLQTNVTRLIQAARALSIQPAQTINGIQHYSENDIERIRAFLLRHENETRPETECR